MTVSNHRALLLAFVTLSACKGRMEVPMAPLPPAIAVDTFAAQPRPVPRFLPLTGTLVSEMQADVAANASGRVLKTLVERGTLVRRDAALVQLDVESARIANDEANASLELYRAQRDLAQAQCRRSEHLYAEDVISADEWDRVATACKTAERSASVAEARTEQAKKSLKDGTVRVPFAGMVSERYVNVGEWVQPSTKVAAVVVLAKLRLELTVPESDLRHVRSGARVEFGVEAYPGETFVGIVRHVDPAVHAATRDFVVEAEVENTGLRLRPGMFAEARLRLPDETRPTVPLTAVRSAAGTPRVFVVANGRIEERIVQLGPTLADAVAIVDGLSPNEPVVSRLTDAIQDGIPVSTTSGEGH